MNLVIDIGNSRIKCALFEHHELLSLHRFLHTELDQLELWLASIQYDRSILSTVVATQDERVRHIISLTQPLILDSSLPLPIQINYHSSDTLGPDRIAAAFGAAHLYPESNVLIINAGSCITYDILTADGGFEGGNIAPGMHMRWQAMHQFTSRLPLVDEHHWSSDHIFGQNTRDALQQGVIRGITFEINAYMDHLLSKYSSLKCVIAGGDAVFFGNQIKRTIFTAPNLVLTGLNQILIKQ